MATAQRQPTTPPPAEAQVPEGDGDLLTVGLVVFFVALIVTVAALLVAPALF